MEAIVANARKVRLIGESRKKDDILCHSLPNQILRIPFARICGFEIQSCHCLLLWRNSIRRHQWKNAYNNFLHRT